MICTGLDGDDSEEELNVAHDLCMATYRNGLKQDSV